MACKQIISCIICLLSAVQFGIASSFENEISNFISELGDIAFSAPNKEVGSRVANWSPNDDVNPEELGSYAEGDILMPKAALSRNGLKSPSSHWKGGIIPYRISDSFNYKDYNTIMAAIEDYHKLTCVKWQRWAGESDYVHFVSGNTGCWSSVGRVGGMQELNLQSPGCLTKKGTVVHEMMHALGFLHEQNRYERDSHVDIVWGNVQQGRENNFQKATAETTDAQGVEYDYRSVMHYSDHAFSANGGPTIRPKAHKRQFMLPLWGEQGVDLSKIQLIRMERSASVWLNQTHYSLPRLGEERGLVWGLTQEDLTHIPTHWYSFPAPHPVNNYLLGFVYAIFFLFAIIGNGLVIWIFATSKSLRTPSNMFVVTLALFDFFMMAKTPIMIYNSMNLGFASGQFWCQIFAFVGSVTGIGASATNACIAYDRYRTIAHPLGGKLSKGKVLLMCFLVWAYALPWAILPLLEIWGRFVPEGYLTTCSFDYLSDDTNNRAFVATLFGFSYILPMTLIIYFYSQIVSHVVAHEKTLREQAKKMNVESLRSNQGQQNTTAEIRIAKAAITICALFVASWTPYAVIALIGSFGNKSLITPGLAMIPACTCKAVACIDPYVYAISHPRYRTELGKRLPWLSGCMQEKQETASVAESTATTTS